MNKVYYKKGRTITLVHSFRLLSIILVSIGLAIVLYVALPLLSWQFYFAPLFASQQIATPIPKTTVLTPSVITSLLAQASAPLRIDYTNAQNWFPNIKVAANKIEKLPITSYSLSIPKLGIKNAEVSTVDYDLGSHLINYGGTQIPPKKGTAVVFGHSTLPQLFAPSDYKTIFATLFTIKTGDVIHVTIAGTTYYYEIFSIYVTDPLDTGVFIQEYDDSYLTLVTCTPPGTTWKRLIVKARFKKINS